MGDVSSLLAELSKPESTVHAKLLGEQQPYEATLQNMQAFTAARDETSLDEFWILEHPPVFTLGRNGKPEHVLNPGRIPVVNIDRGGQVTYHGPGQLVVYLLLDIKRKNIGVRDLVMRMEQAIIQLLAQYGVEAQGDRDAPGVYVNDKKIAALGLRVSRGKTYHGLSLNVDMELAPFSRINPCGYEGLQVTQCRDLGIDEPVNVLAGDLCTYLAQQLDYKQVSWL